MQNESLVDNVNVSTHARRAAERTNGSGKLHDIRHIPEVSEGELDSGHKHWLRRILPHGRPQVMTTDRAKAQGIFIPNWWLAILLIPILLGVLWFFKSQSDIQAAQVTAERLRQSDSEASRVQLQGLKDTLEYRLRSMEQQGKLNDEHLRQIENRIARIEGRKNIAPTEDQ